MKKQLIYLDYNATSPLRPLVRQAMSQALEVTGNPSSVHHFGREARALVERAREAIAAAVNVSAPQVIFTSGGTEANTTALQATTYKTILASAVEHDSILNTPHQLTKVPVDSDGILDLAALEALLKTAEPPALVCLMLANNETGVIQPVAEAAHLAKQYNASFHCDAVQAFGKIPIDFAALDVDFMTLSAHKNGGPKGIGALIVRENLPFQPLITGGGQERRRRAGTENLPTISGFGALAESITDLLKESPKIEALRDELEDGLTIYGQNASRLPNTSCVSSGDIPAEIKVMQLDLAGIAVSAGSACSSGRITPSHVLTAMGLSESEAARAIRISLGWATTEKDIKFLKESL